MQREVRRFGDRLAEQRFQPLSCPNDSRLRLLRDVIFILHCSNG